MSDEDLTIDELTAILADIRAAHGNLPCRYDGGAGRLTRRDVQAALDHPDGMVVDLNGTMDPLP